MWSSLPPAPDTMRSCDFKWQEHELDLTEQEEAAPAHSPETSRINSLFAPFKSGG